MRRSCPISVTPNSARQRLDIELVDRGLVVSRARARDLVLRGEVTVDGGRVGKPALMVGRDAVIELAPGAGAYVSRGALKLAAGLDGKTGSVICHWPSLSTLKKQVCRPVWQAMDGSCPS